MAGRLIMMMGCPGSGKSTFVDMHKEAEDIWVSRDEIRFNLVKPNEEYFSKEKEVFKSFAGTINVWLNSGYTVYADATHLSRASRNKLLRALKVTPKETWVVWIKTPLKLAIERNEMRAGTRAYVPKGQIHRMYHSIEEPSFEERFDKIIIVEPGEPIKIYEEAK